MSFGRVYIFSRPVRTGKTTELGDWCLNRPGVAGIRTPDLQGKRVLQDLKSGSVWPLEADPAEGPLVRVGRFNFLEETFRKAQNILSATAPELTEWLVIDELGKLELAGGGLEPALGQVLARYRQAGTGRILLVIRDTLLAQAISRYGLQGAQVVERLKYLP